jgi:hypothetical protein
MSHTCTSIATKSSYYLQVAGAIIVVVAIIIGVWVLAKRRRSRRQPKTPSNDSLLKLITRWRSGSNQGEYSDQLQPVITTQPRPSGVDLSRERLQTAHVEVELAQNNNRDSTAEGLESATNERLVDRHSSVRSTMTLPVYSPVARPTELVLGREGERAGVDMVLEHPETVDEEERRRDEEMDSLYQIRRARRQEAADREERRRQRREARELGDLPMLARLQVESRQQAEAVADGATVSGQLIAEHQNRNRERRVSSVQYFDVGVARHDGSRVRAMSFDSDNRPLLSSAASPAGRDSISLSTHHRGLSSTSIRSMSSMDCGGLGDPGNGDFEVILLDSRFRSPSMSLAESDPARGAVDPPPNYEHHRWGDAPPYETPVGPEGVSRRSNIAVVPAIEITAALSPATPISRHSNTSSQSH